MRFAIVRLYCGGSGKKGYYNSQEIGLARAMKKLGYDCFIFYPSIRERTICEQFPEEGICEVFCPARNVGVHGRFDWNILLKYKIECAEIETDNQLFAPDVVRFCERHGIPTFNYIGAVNSDSGNKVKRQIMKLLFLYTKSVLKTHSNFAKNFDILNCLQSMSFSASLAPVGLDTTCIPSVRENTGELRHLLNLPQDKTILLFVGRLESYKRPEKLIKIMSSLGNNYFAVMIGNGSLYESLLREITSSGLKNSFLMIKEIPNIEIHRYYAAADFFLNFNDHEIFGMSILEAMYHGITAIAFHAPGPDLIIENGKSGYLVTSTKEMLDLIIDEKHLNRKEIQERVNNHFTWDITAGIFDQWIKKRSKQLKNIERETII